MTVFTGAGKKVTTKACILNFSKKDSRSLHFTDADLEQGNF